MALGIVQSIFIVRLLSVAEYGMIGIVASIGSVFGVYQHLGLASGSTREISAAKDREDVFKIFLTSVFIRYLVTVPLAIGLFVLSRYLAVSKYSNPALIGPLRLYSAVLLIQGVQSMFNSVISGTRRFKLLFTYQAIIAFVSLLLYIPLIYFFRVDGYFFALAIFNLIGSVSLGYLALKPYKDVISFPSLQDFKRLLKDILSISLGVYVVKIIYTMWQKIGPILLGVSVSAEEVGFFSFALLYGAKIMAVSDAVTDVNLPVLSKEFIDNVENFKNLFQRNFNRVFAFMVFSASFAVFWGGELIHILVGSDKYDMAIPLIFPLVYAFLFYGFVNIVKSSVLVPAKMVKEMIGSFVVMFIFTVAFYFLLISRVGFLDAMAIGMIGGAFMGFLLLVTFGQMKLKFVFFNITHVVMLIMSMLASLFNGSLGYLQKSSIFVVYFVVFAALLFYSKVITKENIQYIFARVKNVKKS